KRGGHPPPQPRLQTSEERRTQPALLHVPRAIQLSRELSWGVPDVATLVGYGGGPFDVRVIDWGSALLSDVVRSVLTRTLRQILLVHYYFFPVPDCDGF